MTPAELSEPLAILDRLREAVHVKPVIAFYEETSQDIDRVLDVFIRTNSGGMTLSRSDMLMSIATAHWKGDARSAINGAVQRINDPHVGGFGFSRDFLLKAGLMLAGIRSVAFRVTNFTIKNIELLNDQWDRITDSVYAAARLVRDFGFSQSTLTSHSAVLPVAHYLHSRGGHPRSKKDAKKIREWLTRSSAQARDLGQRSGHAARPTQGSDRRARRGRVPGCQDRGGDEQARQEPGFRTGGATGSGGIQGSRVRPALHPVPVRGHPAQPVPHRSHISQEPLHLATLEGRRCSRRRHPAVPRPCGSTCPTCSSSPVGPNHREERDAPEGSGWIGWGPKTAAEHRQLHDLGEVPADFADFNKFYVARRDRLLGRLETLLGSRIGVAEDGGGYRGPLPAVVAP